MDRTRVSCIAWFLHLMLFDVGVHNILSFKTIGLLIPLGKTILNRTLLHLHPLEALPKIQDPGCSSPWPFFNFCAQQATLGMR